MISLPSGPFPAITYLSDKYYNICKMETRQKQKLISFSHKTNNNEDSLCEAKAARN